jgi:oligopeptide/dipeptide ABC transporter ATP-binding protein
MYLGQIIEEAPVADIFARPAHPYTRGLLASIPGLTGDRTLPLHVIGGKVPSLREVPPGCRFAARCPYAEQICLDTPPELDQVGGGRAVRCHRHAELQEATRD